MLSFIHSDVKRSKSCMFLSFSKTAKSKKSKCSMYYVSFVTLVQGTPLSNERTLPLPPRPFSPLYSSRKDLFT